MRTQPSSAFSKIVAFGMAGAVAGVSVGLGAFGSEIAVPAMLMVAGAALGALVAVIAGARPTRSAAPASLPARAAVALRRTTAREFRLPRRRAAGAAPAPGGTRDPSVNGHAGDRPAPAMRLAPAPSPLVDVNRAGVEELTRLPGVGPAAAARIVADRERHGPFAAPADLERVERFDANRVARLAAQAVAGRPGPEGAPRPAEPVLVSQACPVCGDPVVNPRATYCSPSCKQAAYRQRRRERAAPAGEAETETETASV